jgi:hypothetical protein
MKFDRFDEKIRKMETDLAITEARAGNEKFKLVLSKLTDDELNWLIDVLEKDCFEDPAVQERFWGIMERNGWFDKEKSAC